MLVRVGISQWTGRRYDKAVSAKVATDYGTSADAGRYNKVLVAEGALKTIGKVANDARTYHYAQTLPWNDAGDRMLPSANYLVYTRKMQEFKQAFGAAVVEFCANYPDLVEDARNKLNGMFKAEDYPTVGQIADKYSFDVAVYPLPAAEDFRVSLQAAEVDAIRADIEARTQHAVQAANKELWTRLHDAVSHMADKLADDKGIFRDSLIGNVQDLCELLPRLNVFRDPALEDMRREVERRLCAETPQSLRDNPHARKATAKDASAILQAMAGYTG
ncbi:DUF3150 domain-containing protein [Patescibacteria group bacterium]|nr:DUF3150 domain-containing protein [Patescibacteria group bacterium]